MSKYISLEFINSINWHLIHLSLGKAIVGNDLKISEAYSINGIILALVAFSQLWLCSKYHFILGSVKGTTPILEYVFF